MGFMQFIKSLDDLLYEIMAWLIFFPITLWRVLRHPWQMMDYAAAQLREAQGKQYLDALSPPLFLLIALLIGHGMEIGFVGQSSLVKSNSGLARFITDDTSLLLFRLVLFSLFPLIMSVRLVRLRREKLTRESLQAPFYSQCYLTGPMALLLGGAGVLVQTPHDHAKLIGLALAAVSLLWFGTLQVRWFARKLDVGYGRGFWIASLGMLECVAATFVVTPLVS